MLFPLYASGTSAVIQNYNRCGGFHIRPLYKRANNNLFKLFRQNIYIQSWVEQQ